MSKDIKQLELDLQNDFWIREGNEVLEDLKKRCSFNSTTHIKGDSHESAYLERDQDPWSCLLIIC
jgi:hypothetical protein